MPARSWDKRTLYRCIFVCFVLVPLWTLAPDSVLCEVGKQYIEIGDQSDKGSPIQISGQITVGYDSENRFPFTDQESLSIKNVSGKAILLMVVHIEATTGPERDVHFSEEYFFDDALAPGKVEAQDFDEQRFGATVVNGVPVPYEPDSHPMAKARAEFVQFTDGSTWGDAASAKDVLENRRRTLAELDLLEHLYEQKGESAFLDELAQTDDLRQLKDMCTVEAEYANCTHDGVHRTFLRAKEHEAALAPPSE